MLVLRSNDAEADRRAFAAKGLGNFQRFDFARRAQRPDGSSVDVAFSLAFASCAALPQTGFFVCQQHFPENFWNREAQAIYGYNHAWWYVTDVLSWARRYRG